MRLQSYGKHRMCCRLISPVSLLTLINPIVSCCANFCISFHQCSWLWSSRAPICLMKQWEWGNGCRFSLYWQIYEPRCPTAPHLAALFPSFHWSPTLLCSALQRWRHGSVSGRQHRGHQAVPPQRGHHAHPREPVVQQPRPAAAGHQRPGLLQPCR